MNSVLHFDTSKPLGRFKPLNATNGGPWHTRHALDQWRSNFTEYKKARIPYSRTHDSAYCAVYGRHHSYDITGIFPNFDAPVDDPASYSFACTDEAILTTLEAGTETYFRLGQSIEHEIEKFGTLPPKDFQKWAEICEHIIRHYNEGWANGFHLNIQYWEIWNEADLDPDDAANKRTWGGTKAQFFDLYEIAAKHLKARFPALKIGGPALAGSFEWAKDFLLEMKRRDVPIDFFSWHIYCVEPAAMVERAKTVRALLDETGYAAAESHLNEWNYVRGWTDTFKYSIASIHGLKGAAFIAACICEAQKTSIDLLMYYDTRPSAFCGVFDFYSYEPLKGYYPLYWYGMFYDMQAELRAENALENVSSLCGVDEKGKTLTMVAYYSDDDQAPAKTLSLDFGRPGTYEIYLLDETHDGQLVNVTDKLDFTMTVHSVLLIKEK